MGRCRNWNVGRQFPLGICRSLLAVCLSTIPAANVLLVFAGLESPLLLLSDICRPLSVLLGLDKLPSLVKDICPSMCCFSSACTLLESADCRKGAKRYAERELAPVER